MIIVHGRYGGLCNRLLTFANLVAFAKEHGLTVINPEFSEFAHAFESFRDDPLCVYPLRQGGAALSHVCRRVQPPIVRSLSKAIRRVAPACWVRIGEKGVLRLDDTSAPAIAGMLSRRLSLVSGLYFAAPQSIARHADAVRQLFQPSVWVRDTAVQAVAAARREVDVLIGVHIRQGDYRTFAGGLYYYDTTEYLDVMRRVQEVFPGQRLGFIVCSDTPQDSTAFADLMVFPGPGTTVPDLYTLAGCDYIIGPPSTFSAWASFYGAVPRFVINWKCEDHFRCPRSELNLRSFRVDRGDFGGKAG